MRINTLVQRVFYYSRDLVQFRSNGTLDRKARHEAAVDEELA